MLEGLNHNLIPSVPNKRVTQDLGETKNLELKLHQSMRELIGLSKNNLGRQTEKLHALSPLAFLSKGFALVKKDKHLISSVEDIEIS